MGGNVWPTRTFCSDIHGDDQCNTNCGCRGVSKCNLLFTAVLIKGANIQTACCFIWLVATIWSSFPLLGWGEYVPEPYGLSCTIAWRSYNTSVSDTVYIVCSFSLFMLIPFLLIVVSQCKILHTISRLSCQVSAGNIRNKLKRTEKKLSWVNNLLLFRPCLLN